MSHVLVSPFPTSENKSTTEYVGRLGLVKYDPADPLKRYMLVDCQSAFSAGEPVVIDGSGLASRLVSTSIGQVGIIVAAVSGSDTVAWAQITGLHTAAFCSCEVSTVFGTLIGYVTTDSTAAYFDANSSGGNIVYGARAITSGTTATSPFPAAKAALFQVLLAQGGAYVNGIAGENIVTS
jgi:hypothetical protein